MPVRKQLSVRLPNSPGSLVAVCRVLAAERVSIAALSLDGHGQLRLIVDNHVLATGALRREHYQITEQDVLVMSVPHGAGGLASVAGLLAGTGVNIEYAYTGPADHAGLGLVVAGVQDAARAAAAAGA
jgi:hypothetical protein